MNARHHTLDALPRVRETSAIYVSRTGMRVLIHVLQKEIELYLKMTHLIWKKILPLTNLKNFPRNSKFI